MNKENLEYRIEKNKNELLFFDAAKEVEYLRRIDDGKRYVALEEELKTAMQELFWVQGGALDRVLDSGRIKDPKTDIFVDQFMTENPLDKSAFDKIQNGLSEGNNLMVHFSPRNIELGYPMNVVDFWINDKKNEEIKYLRFFVEDDFYRLRSIYENFGGKEEISSSSDLLVNPLAINDFRMANVMANLTQVDKRIETTKDRIDGVVNEVINNFYENFGENIFSRKELIERLYSGIYEVILEGKSLDEVEIKVYMDKRVEDYMYAQILDMKVRNTNGACPGIVMTAEFGSGKTMQVVKEGGSFIYKEVSDTSGLKHCEACGFWYSGEKCPLCN